MIGKKAVYIMDAKKRRPGDRRDGRLLRELDSLHFITGVLYPNRCDNEAYVSVKVDLTAMNAWLEKANAAEPDFKFTLFHMIVTAMEKTVYLRPALNRFIVNGNFYQRNEISASFIVKKQFADGAGEGLAILKAAPEDTAFTVHEAIRRQVFHHRSGGSNSTNDSMDLFNKMPRFLSKFLIRLVMRLDKHGWVPRAFISDDPYYCSMVLSNLGSIRLKCGYHHLTNWGTCSLFCVIGEKKLSPFFDAEGKAEMRETVELGLTIDERLADGYYYSKSVRLLKHLLEHPELLEKPLCEEVDY